MRYLFFDTESANSFNNVHKMCEWGSLMSNEAFLIYPGSKKDMLINPGRDGKFKLTGRKGSRDLILSHPYEEYLSAPLFDNRYAGIEFLLTQKETMIFLWAAENDIQAVLDQCRRYHLPEISFVSYDVQTLFASLFPESKEVPSLEKAMAALELSIDGITPHKPDDDALMTSSILKALCAKAGKSASELVKECPQCRKESLSTYAKLKKLNKKKEEQKERASALAPYHAELNAILAQGISEGTPKEKVFSVSAKMKMHIDETLPKIKVWLERGYHLRRSLNAAYLVYYDEDERRELESKLNLEELKLISADEFDAITNRLNEDD